MKWLANNHPDAVRRNMEYIPEFGRWDDLYCLEGTPVEREMFAFIRKQLILDAQVCGEGESKGISLLAKWLKSENASSKETIRLANKTREALGMTHKQYRMTLSMLRDRINVLERLMSQNRWEEIEFDKIPSKAGLIYKNAFARRDMIKQKYEAFAKDVTTKVNAGTLYPYEVVEKALSNNTYYGSWSGTSTDRAMVNKYWENLTDYFNGATLDSLCVIDTSASMRGTPLNVAIALGMYCAERAGGPFANHYISFSSRPQLIEVAGSDFVDKVQRIWKTNLCENTNIEATFDMILRTMTQNHCTQEDLPKNIIIVSDMEFDRGTNQSYGYRSTISTDTLMEKIAQKWRMHGFEMPHLIYWNVDARQNNVPMLGKGPISYVSGFSPSIFQTIMTGKTGYDLMMECLNKERYAMIQ